MKYLWAILALGLMAVISHAGDVDSVDQRYIDQLTRGGMISIKQAAQSIYNTGERDTEVIDVAAEVLLQRYATATNSDIDGLAWLCRAIGNSRNGRYFSVLSEVEESNTHKKLRKYAKNARKDIGSASGEQYQQGSVDLVGLRDAGHDAPQRPAVVTTTPASGAESLDIIREGMSMEEVYALVGTPSGTTSHQTGKAWIPFNYKGADLVRTIALYKGQGRVVFSRKSRYDSTMRVLEVLIDANETGYP